MLNSFSPERGSDLAHFLFDTIVCLLEFFLLLVESFEVVVIGDDDLRGAIELAPEVRDCLFQSFHVRNGFFAPLSPQPCPHGSPFLVFPPVVLRQCPFFSYLSGVIAGVHLFPSVFVAIVVKTMLPACDVSMGPSGPSLTRLLLRGPVHSWVCFHFLSPIMVVGDAWLSRSPGELWVPA